MRSLGFWVILGSLGAVAVFVALSFKLVFSPGIVSVLINCTHREYHSDAAVLYGYKESLKPTPVERNLKAWQSSFKRTDSIRRYLITNVITQDYPTFDPAPSSKASIQPKPIEHGTPLMPYIPGPTPPPPCPPKHGGPRNP